MMHCHLKTTQIVWKLAGGIWKDWKIILAALLAEPKPYQLRIVLRQREMRLTLTPCGSKQRDSTAESREIKMISLLNHCAQSSLSLLSRTHCKLQTVFTWDARADAETLRELTDATTISNEFWMRMGAERGRPAYSSPPSKQACHVAPDSWI